MTLGINNRDTSVRVLLQCSALALLVLFLASAGGCATGLSHEEANPESLLHDAAFPRHAEHVVETRSEVFHLDQAAKNHLDMKVNRIRDFHARGRALIDEIFHQARLNLAYDSNANTTATETFHERAANCLSMSILAYAMAEYSGFSARFQEVDIPEYWERRDGYSLMNQHVNVRITPKLKSHTMLVARKIELEIDFQPLADVRDPPTQLISQSRALAMFYNNKGIDALLDGRHAVAYAYLKAALLHDPTLDMAMTNLGLLYAINGHRDWAEESYRQATRVNDENAIAAESLARLLHKSGRDGEADAILARLDKARRNNPFFQYIQGEEAFDNGDWRTALDHFRKAAELKPETDQFHFGLARAYLKLGNPDRAEFHLRRAERNANYTDLKQKYRDKLTALSVNPVH